MAAGVAGNALGIFAARTVMCRTSQTMLTATGKPSTRKGSKDGRDVEESIS